MDNLISEEKVQQSIKRLKANQSPGPDGYTVEFYKCSANFLSGPWAEVCNHILTSGALPVSWLEHYRLYK